MILPSTVALRALPDLIENSHHCNGKHNKMNNIFHKSCITIIFLMASTLSQADHKYPVAGDWCFYEQEGYGQKISEKVDISFSEDGKYKWIEGTFQQTGEWSISDGKLDMTHVGSHSIISIGNEEMELKRMSTMRFKKGKCDARSFSSQDITAFHNAAATGDKATIDAYLSKNMDINIVDWNKGDTALIKATKFCQIEIAKHLVQRGANKTIKNEEGKAAHEYAQSSQFHKGCDDLVTLLR